MFDHISQNDFENLFNFQNSIIPIIPRNDFSSEDSKSSKMSKQEAGKNYWDYLKFYNYTQVSNHKSEIPENIKTSEYDKKTKIITKYYDNLLSFAEEKKNYLQISNGINHATREIILIDYDNSKDIVPIILEQLKEISDSISIIQKNNNKCQIQININPITVKYKNKSGVHDTFYHNSYNKITKFLNFLFDGDLRYTGWRCQNPFYARENAKENKNKYKFIKIPTKTIDINFLYDYLVKKFNFDINKKYKKLEKETLDVWESKNLNLNSNNFNENSNNFNESQKLEKELLKTSEFIFNSNLNNKLLNKDYTKNINFNVSSIFLIEDSRNIRLFKEAFKIISRDKTRGIQKSLQEYLNELSGLYEEICIKLNKFKDKASLSQIQSIIKSAYNRSVNNFIEYGRYSESQRKVSELIRFSNKVRNYLSITKFKTYGQYLKSNIKNKISSSYFYELKKLDILYFKRRLLDFLNYNFDFYSSYLNSIIDTLLNTLYFKQSVQYYQLFEINSDFECIFPSNNPNFNPYFKIYEENLKLIA